MNFMPESTAGTSRDDRAHQIITGNRTDHRRPCSSPTSSTSFSYYKPTQSPTMSSAEEVEDMANCLIMLAHSTESPTKQHKSDLYSHKNDTLKLRSVTEMLADETAGGNSGFQSYECKTCNRTFPSFQALGGHRASHKKPKLTTEDKSSLPIKTDRISKEDEQKLIVDYEENKIISNSVNRSSSPAITGFIQTGYKNCKGKIHECSICGSEFLSGQALGGHMRRHRTLPPSVNQIAVSTNMKYDSSGHHITGKSPVLSLDLNLPAPEVVDDSHSNFQFTSSSSQKPLVFSAAALVDCHY